MISVIDVQDEIIKNPQHIECILEHLGHTHIRDRGKYYQCPNLDGDNNTAISVLKTTLQYNNYTRGTKGNIITLVQDEKKCSFPKSLEYIAGWIGIRESTNVQIKYPFHSFYKNINKSISHPELSMKVYSESDLPPKGTLSKLWVEDGVDLLTQENWGIRLCLESNRIIIPEYSFDGKLIGAKARVNDKNCPLDKRWSMALPFSKSLCCYGWCHNYKDIQSKSICVITESEKSVLQAQSWGFKYNLAVGGHCISDTQARYIKSLMCDKVIVAFDEGISDDELEYESKKLKFNNFMQNNKVGFIRTGDLLENKDSPMDHGSKIFKELITKHVTWVS